MAAICFFQLPLLHFWPWCVLSLLPLGFQTPRGSWCFLCMLHVAILQSESQPFPRSPWHFHVFLHVNFHQKSILAWWGAGHRHRPWRSSRTLSRLRCQSWMRYHQSLIGQAAWDRNHGFSCHVASVSCNFMQCHALSCHVMPCHAMPCHAISCQVMPCQVMPCHVRSCHVSSMKWLRAVERCWEWGQFGAHLKSCVDLMFWNCWPAFLNCPHHAIISMPRSKASTCKTSWSNVSKVSHELSLSCPPGIFSFHVTPCSYSRLVYVSFSSSPAAAWGFACARGGKDCLELKGLGHWAAWKYLIDKMATLEHTCEARHRAAVLIYKRVPQAEWQPSLLQ